MSTQSTRVAPSSKAFSGRGRLVRRDGDGYAVYAIDAGASPSGSALWVVTDQNGRVVESARSELIAIAKMQALTLSRLSAAIGGGSSLGEPRQVLT